MKNRRCRTVVTGLCLLLLCCVCSFTLGEEAPGLSIADTFPDEQLQNLLRQKGFDKNQDGYLSDAEIAGIVSLKISRSQGYNVKNLTGLSCLSALEELNIIKCDRLTTVNTGGNPGLKKLMVSSCDALTAVDVSQNAALEVLACRENGIIDTLDVSQNAVLKQLVCNDCNLFALDVSKNSKLEVLTCNNNTQLATLDLSGNPLLKHLNFQNCNLSSLTIHPDAQLEFIYCDGNPLVAPQLDYSLWPHLTTISCEGNGLTVLDVSRNTELTMLCCAENQLSRLDVSGLENLFSLYCEDNQLSELILKNNGRLATLCCQNNMLASVNTKEAPGLEVFFCDGNQLTDLQIAEMSILARFSCKGNQLTSLTLPASFRLREVFCQGNRLTFLDVRPSGKLNSIVTDGEVKTKDGDFGQELWYYVSESELLVIDAFVEVICGAPDPEPVIVSGITLNKTKETLTRTGKTPKPTLPLQATVLPAEAENKSVTWSSSKPKVAQVDQNGKVTALSAGTTVITCAAKNGSGAKATCTVTVKDAKVAKITLNKTRATLKVGKTLKLKVKKFAPASPLNSKVKWSSNKPKIAKVDKNGKVTALKKGTAIITCEAQDKSKTKATCKITVKAK